MPNYVISGQSFNIVREARDGLGRHQSGFSAPDTAFTFIDELDVTYPAIMSAWVNGYATFTLTAPVVTSETVKTFRRLYNDVELPGSPAQLDVRVVLPYQGSLDLSTNCVFASDGAVGTPGVTDQLFDYSLHSGTYKNILGTAVSDSWFTDTTQYKIGPSGTLTTLGRACISSSSNLAEATTMLQSLPSLNRTAGDQRFYDLCTGVEDLTLLPIKTMIGVYAKQNGQSSGQANFFGYRCCSSINTTQGGTATSQFGVSPYYTNSPGNATLGLAKHPTSTSGMQVDVATVSLNGIFNADKEAVMIAMTIVPASSIQSTVYLYVNGILKITYTAWMQTNSTEATNQEYLTGLGGFINTYSINTTAMLDFACYSDIKDDAFILAQAQAWGF